jgi:hypothetical protein
VNFPTSRCSAPAAATRTGRGAIALPGDPGLDRLLADPRLGSTAKTIATALVKNWAWSKPDCWPSDKTIAGKVGKSPGHVQRCLRELEAAGWIARERTDEVPTGRRIWLAWRCPITGKGAQGDRAPAREDPPAPARDKRIVVVKGEVERGEVAIPERQRPEPVSTPQPAPAPEPEPPVVPAPVEVAALSPPPPAQPAPRSEAPAPSAARLPSPGLPLTPEQSARLAELPEATRDLVLTWLMSSDRILVAEAQKKLAPLPRRPAAPRTLPEVLGRIREDPSFPALAADWLSSALGDRKSYSGFKARCEEAWRGELPVDRLVSAYEQATSPRAKKPGAIFMHALRCRDGQPPCPAGPEKPRGEPGLAPGVRAPGHQTPSSASRWAAIGPARSPVPPSAVGCPTASAPLRLRE